MWVVVVATLVISSVGFAQSTFSSLVGFVTDASGALVTDASLTLTNTATGISYVTKTDSHGSYRFSQLLPGTYKMRSEASGFRAQEVRPFTLLVDQEARQDVILTVGKATESVIVSASSVDLNTENATEGQVIEERSIQDMPLNGRNFMQLAQLSDGVVPIVNGMNTPASAWSGGGTVSLAVNGLREDDVSYLYDGIEVRNGWYGQVGIRPSIDNIQEFKVERTGSSAAYGAGGAFVNVVTKSGSSQVHGTLFEFVRNNDLDARNFFDQGAAPAYHQNQFGGSAGGPIRKNKMFFFVNYEGYRQIQPGNLYGNVPTAEMLQGDFSAFTKPILNPFDNYKPFAENKIPAKYINASGALITSFYPAPNGSFAGGQNYHAVTDSIDNWDQVSGRLDYTISSKNTVYGRYTWQQETDTSAGLTKYGQISHPTSPQNVSVGWTHLVTSSVINDARFGWNHSEVGSLRAFGYDTSLANPFDLKDEANQPGSYGLPSITANAYGNPGSSSGTEVIRENMFMGTDGITIQKGKNVFTTGMDIRYDPIYLYEDWASANINFNGAYTGDAIADMLVGIPSGAGTAVGNPTLNFRKWYQTYYVQDELKVASNLTVTAGLRWEHNQQPVETKNNVGSFDAATGVMLTYPDTSSLGLGRAMVKGRYTDFSPRIGIAWNPAKSHTVVRAGFGRYYLQANYNQYEQEVDTPKLYLDYSFSNPAPGKPLLFTVDQLFNTDVSSPFTLVAFENINNKTPYSDEWSFTVERSFGTGWLAEIGYFGSVGRHIEMRPNINAFLPDGTTPYANYQGGIAEGLNGGNSSYNDLTAKIEKSYRSGWSLLASYSYSKCLDYPWQDEFTYHPFNPKEDYGHCTSDITQRLVTSAVYELPFGKNKTFLNKPGVADAIIGGWKLSQIGSFSTGPWESAGGDQNVGTLVEAAPNVSGQVNNSTLRHNIRKDGLGPYFNVGAFSQVPHQCCGDQGNAPRNFIIAPGLDDWDLSLFKEWSAFERYKLSFRSDFFNAFNHTNFNGLSTGVSSSNFGYVTSAANAREIQLSLRLAF
jgi:outer membrane receptor protein involved in Fe transport